MVYGLQECESFENWTVFGSFSYSFENNRAISQVSCSIEKPNFGNRFNFTVLELLLAEKKLISESQVLNFDCFIEIS